MADRLWLYVGMGSLAILIGFLVGASSSPVAGLAITAAFGVIAGIVSYMVGPKTSEPFPMAVVGQTLIGVSAAMAIGLGLGMYARLIAVPRWMTETRELPWAQSKTPPTDATVALDWIVVDQRLRAFGYTEQQIQAIYAIDAADNVGEFRRLANTIEPTAPQPAPSRPIPDAVRR